MQLKQSSGSQISHTTAGRHYYLTKTANDESIFMCRRHRFNPPLGHNDPRQAIQT